MILPSCTIIHAENKVIFAQNKDCSVFARCASHTRRIRFFAENAPKMPDLRPLPSLPSRTPPAPGITKRVRGFGVGVARQIRARSPRPPPAADRVRRRDTPPPRRPPTQKNTRRFRVGCRWICSCRDYFLTSPKRTAVTAPLPSEITTLMVCWPAPMLVLSSTVTQPELRPLSPLLLSYVKDFTSTSST